MLEYTILLFAAIAIAYKIFFARPPEDSSDEDDLFEEKEKDNEVEFQKVVRIDVFEEPRKILSRIDNMESSELEIRTKNVFGLRRDKIINSYSKKYGISLDRAERRAYADFLKDSIGSNRH